MGRRILERVNDAQLAARVAAQEQLAARVPGNRRWIARPTSVPAVRTTPAPACPRVAALAASVATSMAQ